MIVSLALFSGAVGAGWARPDPGAGRTDRENDARHGGRFGKPVDATTIKQDVDGLAVKPASRARMAEFAARADARVSAQLLYENITTDMRPALKSMALPVTVIVPWSTRGFGKERTLAFYRRQYADAPDVRFVDIAGSGHFVMLDQPQAFIDALAQFTK
jgi:pimeloyl-ACP methyl ester carboxylesterase